MPTKINYPFATSSGGASLEFTGPINASQSLDTSGYYFSDNLTENIGIDCSGLGLGAYVNWVNLSTKAIVFYGLATVNGAAIPANKGLRMEANTSIEFFLKDANFNARVLVGNYSINWIPGLEPFVTLDYSFNGDDKGLIYYLGTNQRTTSFSVTNVTNNATVTAISTYGTDYPSCAVDRGTTGGSRSLWSTTTAAVGNWWKIDLGVQFSIQLNKIICAPVDTYYNWDYGVKFQGSNDNINWEDLTPNTTFNSLTWGVLGITNTTYWRYIRFYGTTNGSALLLKEIEFYGYLQGN